MSLSKKELIQMFADQLLKCYDDSGKTKENYQQKIKLPDLDDKEFEILKRLFQ